MNMKRVFFTTILELINNYQHFFLYSPNKKNREIFSKKNYLKIFNADDQ